MDKILEALKKIVPAEQIEEVSAAIKDMVAEQKKELEAEFDSKLEEAYAQLTEEKTKDEEVAYQGYQEAAAMIEDLRNRLDMQKNEYESHMDSEFEEAFQALQAEKAKNETLEVKLYEEYEAKLDEMRTLIVDKINEFLTIKGKEIYEQARRELINNPRTAEEKVVLNKIVETVSDYISDDDYAVVTSKKLEETSKKLDELKGQLKIAEARSIRLSTENSNLNEQVRQMNKVITENKDNKQERTKKAEQATGRGNIVTEDRIISEVADDKTTVNPNVDRTFVESLDPEYLESIRKLSGVSAKK